MTVMRTLILTAAAALGAVAAFASPRIVLTDHRLMHETRATAYPGATDTVGCRPVSLQWPLPEEFAGQYDPMDGFMDEAPNPDKSNVVYRVRYSTDPAFSAAKTTEVRTPWAMYNIFDPLTPGTWYWQWAYGEDGPWSETVSFTVADCDNRFAPPSFAEFERLMPATHPRVWADAATLDDFRRASTGKTDANWYIEYANNAMANPMLRIEDIDTSQLDNLEDRMQRMAYMTQQSRRIIDAEEKNCEALIRAYVLTGYRPYGEEAIKRVLTITGWGENENVVGDFNDATILSLAAMTYDCCNDLLTPEQTDKLLAAVKKVGNEMYGRFNNYVESYLFEDHIWQMAMRITAMAALATMDRIDDARTWADYCYNLWIARMPGINSDGAWHNGDSYFSVNTRTLIELPWLFSHITGVNFFSDPWYEGSAMYTMYQQPPFSKSGGNGSMHLNVGRPPSNRIGYLDALARLTGNTYAADYVRRFLAENPDYLKKSLLSKPGDLGWFRLRCGLELPEGPGLASLPHARVFPESGLASAISDWDNHRKNAWWSFRSSPYGSHSHTLANQNAFNTFYAGKPLFYSSGHHIGFSDRHTMICHRGTLAHNTILPGGFTQKIGVEGYGWIPRHYEGDAIAYVLGDASNAYGPVESPLWLLRGRQSNVEYSRENGWGDPHLRTFRRHIVDLGFTGLIFIYDELEADSALQWHYRLHSVAEPLVFRNECAAVCVKAHNGKGTSEAYIFAASPLDCDVTDKFLIPAADWLKNGGKERPNHSHFTAKTPASLRAAFATVVDTRADNAAPVVPQMSADGVITVGKWIIKPVLDGSVFAFEVTDTTNGNSVRYRENEPTVVVENGVTSTLNDVLPRLEM